MAIEDGLYPLAYDIHTIKYLQQCKISLSVKTTCKQLAKLHQLICKVLKDGAKWKMEEKLSVKLTLDFTCLCLAMCTVVKPTC